MNLSCRVATWHRPTYAEKPMIVSMMAQGDSRVFDFILSLAMARSKPKG